MQPLHLLKLGLLLFVAAYASAATWLNVGSYSIADDYSVRFDTRAAEGSFTGLKGEIVFDAADLDAASFDVSVQVSTISTGNTVKDKHARGSSWLDAEKYPTIGFRSTGFAKAPIKGDYIVSGSLTLHGVSKEVDIPFSFRQNSSAAGGTFRGSTTVSREAYGIEGPFGQFAVGDEIDIELVVPVK